jgi:hypothetical protein
MLLQSPFETQNEMLQNQLHFSNSVRDENKWFPFHKPQNSCLQFHFGNYRSIVEHQTHRCFFCSIEFSTKNEQKTEITLTSKSDLIGQKGKLDGGLRQRRNHNCRIQSDVSVDRSREICQLKVAFESQRIY